jgi:hypothetical protein
VINLFPEFFFLNFIHIQIVPDFIFLIFEDFLESVGLLIDFFLFAEFFQLVQFKNPLVLFGGLLQGLLELLVGLLQRTLLVEKLLELFCEGQEL